MDSWLVWGATLFGWVPAQTLQQRHGDLIRMSDALMRQKEGGTR